MALHLEKFVPTLVIGIGGTGSKVLEQLLQFIKDEDRIKTLEENNLFEFAALDTDLGELDNLKIKNKIRTSENLILADYIRVRRREDKEFGKTSLDWLPSEKEFPKAFFDFDISSGAGQIRLYSRLALEKTSAQIYSLLQSAISRLRSINNKGTATQATNVNIYIVCSIAGGTGAGAFLQIAAMIKYILRSGNKQGNVRAYVISPDIYTKGDILPYNQLDDIKANAYGVLKEVDAFYKLMARGKSYGLFTEEDMEFVFSPNLNIKSHDDFGNSPLDFVYLIDSSNKSGSLTIDKGVMFKLYERMVADSLYASIFSPISSKAASVENNTIRMKFDASLKKLDYPGYGALGAGRLVFPVDDISNYLGHRFVSDVICKNWKEMDASYYMELKEYEKAKQIGEEKMPPMRHEMYIQYIDGKAGSDRAPAEIKIAYNLYKNLEKDKLSFTDGVEKYIAGRYIQFFNENTGNSSEDESAHFNYEERLIEVPRSPSHTIPIANRIGNIKRNVNRENWESQIHQDLNKIDDLVKKLESHYTNNERSLMNNMIAEIINDDKKARSKPDSINEYKLIKWLTIDTKKEGMNIFFVRYFFSRQLNEFFKLREDASRRKKQAEEDIKQIEKLRKYAGGGKEEKTPFQLLEDNLNFFDWKSPFKTLRAVFFKKSIYLDFYQGKGSMKKFDSYTNKYLEAKTQYFYSSIREKVLEKLIGLISYEYRGRPFANENGFLEIIHKTFDYVSGSLEEEFHKATEVLENNSPTVDKMGVTRGVYHNKKAKQNIWKNIGAGSDGSVSRINETYQSMLDGIEKSWRSIDEMQGNMDKEMLKIKKESVLKSMNSRFKEDLLSPSRDYFKIALNERYNILTAMKEEYQLTGVIEDLEIDKRILQELRKLFDDCSPFAKTMDVSSVQSIATIAYSEELLPHKIEEYIGQISNESGTGNVPSLKNKQIILVLRSQVGFTINDFKTINDYFEAYLKSSLTRHIDYRWDYQLPEASMEQEAYFAKLFLRAESLGIFRYLQNAEGVEDGRSEFSGNYFQSFQYSGQDNTSYDFLGSDFKQTYFSFKKIMKQNHELRFKLLESHKEARDLDFSGADTSYSESIERILGNYSRMIGNLPEERRTVVKEIQDRILWVYEKEFFHIEKRREAEKNKIQ